MGALSRGFGRAASWCLLCLLLLMLPACMVWPRGGGGGLAERHAELPGPLRETAKRLRHAEDQGARQRHPAAMRRAEDLTVSAHRAQQAGLYAEAEEDLHQAERILRQVTGGDARREW